MGAAGLTCSTSETAAKASNGMEIDVLKVPRREAKMSPYEIMLSESQERMLMILKPGAEPEARRIFERWELDFAVIGRVTETGHLVLKSGGRTVADLPVEPLVTEAPMYERPWVATPSPKPVEAAEVPEPADLVASLKQLLACPDLASKRWIWEQYDHLVRGDTVQRPGGDAAVVRVADTSKALAITVDCTPRYCQADPATGGAQAVAETWRNLTAVGATPLAITDNMNFGNPEKPEIMGQFAGCIEGMRAACLALDYPVVSGNVSLYNETSGNAILPTPAIGGVGLLGDVTKTVGLALPEPGLALILIGATLGHLGATLFLREIARREEGAPPPVDLAAERRHGDLVRAEIAAGRVAACHDLSDGGLFVGLAEMVMAGKVGAEVTLPETDVPRHALLFGEDQGRYLVATREPDAILAEAKAAGIPAFRLGKTGGNALTVQGVGAISAEELRRVNEAWLPAYMAAP
jgi:phosphoribosylformylglycinamidine synthase